MSPDREPAGFTGLALRPELHDALAELGYTEPTPIQREAIPVLLAGHDLLGQAATGTGKTAAFALPVLHRHEPAPTDRADTGRAAAPTALVLAPTRELAVQVSEAFRGYGQRLGARVLAVYGGESIGRQLHALARGVDIVVATPGRALDHLRRGTLRLDAVRTVVLDEADEMLDMGFAEDIEAILDQTPTDRQTVLFSATMPARIDAIARRYLREPVRVELGAAPVPPGEAARVRQQAYLVARQHKPAALGRILDVESPTAALVFCRTREAVEQLTETMTGRGYRAEPLHGGMGQPQRDRVMTRLRAGTADLVIATDVAARGIDVDQLSHVVNYDLPLATEAYVHRTGRVGRAGREGVAISIVEPREQRMLKAIERATGQPVPIAEVPTVAQLRARRLDRTRAALRQTLLDVTGQPTDQPTGQLAGQASATGQADLEQYRPVLERLGEEFAPVDVALAALKLAHEATVGDVPDEQDIPPVARPRERPARGARDDRADRGRDKPGARRRPTPAAATPGMAKLFLGSGRRAGLRPHDLVGAIAGESRLTGRDVGSVEIFDRFSLVEVPESAADSVITALRRTTIKGKKIPVRRDQAVAVASHA